MRQLRALSLIAAMLVCAGEPDLEIGEEINEVCADCHGEFGQGGKQGVYPPLVWGFMQGVAEPRLY